MGGTAESKICEFQVCFLRIQIIDDTNETAQKCFCFYAVILVFAQCNILTSSCLCFFFYLPLHIITNSSIIIHNIIFKSTNVVKQCTKKLCLKKKTARDFVSTVAAVKQWFLQTLLQGMKVNNKRMKKWVMWCCIWAVGCGAFASLSHARSYKHLWKTLPPHHLISWPFTHLLKEELYLHKSSSSVYSLRFLALLKFLTLLPPMPSSMKSTQLSN